MKPEEKEEGEEEDETDLRGSIASCTMQYYSLG
jgi:hypothetical protein